jgi:hypothetical protein
MAKTKSKTAKRPIRDGKGNAKDNAKVVAKAPPETAAQKRKRLLEEKESKMRR